jgi:hypothetical protein
MACRFRSRAGSQRSLPSPSCCASGVFRGAGSRDPFSGPSEATASPPQGVQVSSHRLPARSDRCTGKTERRVPPSARAFVDGRPGPPPALPRNGSLPVSRWAVQGRRHSWPELSTMLYPSDSGVEHPTPPGSVSRKRKPARQPLPEPGAFPFSCPPGIDALAARFAGTMQCGLSGAVPPPPLPWLPAVAVPCPPANRALRRRHAICFGRGRS